MMIAWWASRIAEAVREPRVSARRILDARLSAVDALAMVIVAAALDYILFILVWNYGPAPEQLAELTGAEAAEAAEAARPSFSGFLGGLGMRLIVIYVLTLMVWGVGRGVGGVAERWGLIGLVAWHGLALTPLTALGALARVTVYPPALGLLFQFGALAIALYVLSAFVAEAHEFKSVWSVLLAFCAGGLIFLMVLLIVIGPRA